MRERLFGNDDSLYLFEDLMVENPDYLSKQLITYIGNKRALLPHIEKAIERIKKRLGKRQLKTFDVFSGSGVVSRLFKSHSSLLISNDFESYAAVIGRCYLSNKSEVDFKSIGELVNEFNNRVNSRIFEKGFIEELYSPKDESCITKEDRVFYTRENARRIDDYRRLIGDAPKEYFDLLVGPLLSKASIHANTAGVFKGFYKNRKTGIGQFGGTGSDALKRILGKIELEFPVLSNFECEYRVYQEDSNVLARKLPSLDLAYIDPPYNQHPYGSNYFMLNLIVEYDCPKEISKVSGIPKNWKRSGYNVKNRSLGLLCDLIESLDATHLLISFNNEGFVSTEEMLMMLKNIGIVERIEIPYTTFRGSRNLKNRSVSVTEQLFLVERG